MTRFFLNFPFFKKKKYQQQQLEFRVCVFIKARRELLCSSDGLVSWHNLPAFLPFYYFFSASGRVCISSRFTEIYRHAQHSVDDGWQRFFCSPSILYSNNINVMKSKNFSTLSFVETRAFSSHFLYFQFFCSSHHIQQDRPGGTIGWLIGQMVMRDDRPKFSISLNGFPFF